MSERHVDAAPVRFALSRRPFPPTARDYLRFANGAFAGCSIPDWRPCTYRGDVG